MVEGKAAPKLEIGRRFFQREYTINMAASRSALPSASVTIASTINPLRFSISTCPL